MEFKVFAKMLNKCLEYVFYKDVLAFFIAKHFPHLRRKDFFNKGNKLIINGIYDFNEFYSYFKKPLNYDLKIDYSVEARDRYIFYQALERLYKYDINDEFAERDSLKDSNYRYDYLGNYIMYPIDFDCKSYEAFYFCNFVCDKFLGSELWTKLELFFNSDLKYGLGMANVYHPDTFTREFYEPSWIFKIRTAWIYQKVDDIFAFCDPCLYQYSDFTNSEFDSYLIRIKKEELTDIYLYPQKVGYSVYRFTVTNKNADLATLVIWAYFSSYIRNKRENFLLRPYFSELGIINFYKGSSITKSMLK